MTLYTFRNHTDDPRIKDMQATWVKNRVLVEFTEPVFVHQDCVMYGCSNDHTNTVVHDCDPGYVQINKAVAR